MRIAVSGTHCSGKSTLAHDFAAAHSDFVHLPEPYDLIEELYGEPLGAEPTADDFFRQLEVSVETLRDYPSGARLIAERSPLDFLAYLLALGDLGRDRHSAPIDPAATLAASGIEHIDLLVVLPLNDADAIDAPEEEDLALRDAMNDRLLEIITTDPFDLLSGGRPRVIEVHGSRGARLAAIERAIVAC
ncbi:MAG TPA: AAA family ATPase [Thermoanaerobaculia bacterium]|nr:AAA family ATPase [Thermoanaerobaculia bacterium]